MQRYFLTWYHWQFWRCWRAGAAIVVVSLSVRLFAFFIACPSVYLNHHSCLPNLLSVCHFAFRVCFGSVDFEVLITHYLLKVHQIQHKYTKGNISTIFFRQKKLSYEWQKKLKKHINFGGEEIAKLLMIISCKVQNNYRKKFEAVV